MKIQVAIDNGSSGSIAILFTDETSFYAPTPVKEEQSYTKSKNIIKRLDHKAFKTLLQDQLFVKSTDGDFIQKGPIHVSAERPMINPMRFKASVLAARCLEAQLVILEQLGLPVEYVDSKQWQKAMLPAGLEKDELKTASRDIGRRLFPQHKITKDADALLMAEWARRENL